MPPKKDKKGKAPPVEAEPEVASLYVKREPLPLPEPPDTTEVEDAWKAGRGNFLPSLPEWDAEAVNITDWMPANSEPFVGSNFSAQALPKAFLNQVTGWKRASLIADAAAGVEEEPKAQQQLPDLEEPAVVADAGKGVNTKAKAQPAAKGKAKEDPAASSRDTMKQFADAQGKFPETDMCVVSDAETRTRTPALSFDEALPPFSQALAALFAVVAEHRSMLPKGAFLWELIYPQDNEGKPLYNPQGKYIVRLFVQGQWRQVLIDDIVPVGAAGSAQNAPVFPSSSQPNVLWPQLLTKAIMRAFQADLQFRGELPIVTALTGWLPFHQSPLTWEALKWASAYRPFCCLPAPSKPDPEARQRDALMAASAQVQGQLKGGAKPSVPALLLPTQGPPAPRLSGPLCEAPLQFLVCELAEEPQQVRLKAGQWKPKGGTPRKYILRDGEVEHEDDDLGAEEDDEDDLDDDDGDMEGDEEEEAASPDDNEKPSARSQEEGEQESGAGAEEELGEPGEEEEQPVPAWPESLPAPAMLRSEAKAYREQLEAGFWITFDTLQSACDSIVAYMPPGELVLKACLDSRWVGKRNTAFRPPPLHLLRLRLVPTPELQEDIDGGPSPGSTPPWCRVIIAYEPLRLDPMATQASGKPLPVGLGGGTCACLLQRMGRWEPPTIGMQAPPEFIQLVSGEKQSAGATTRCCMMPPGEHLYLILDDAIRAGSTLSVYVDGSRFDLEQSSIEFLELPTFFEDAKVPMQPVALAEYPAQQGFSIWAKSEVQLAGESLASKSLEIMSYLPNPSLYQHLTLSILQMDDGGAAKTLLRSPLLKLISMPLGPVCLELTQAHDANEVAAGGNKIVKCVLVLEANIPSPGAAGTFTMQLALPPCEMPSAEQLEADEREPLPEGEGAVEAPPEKPSKKSSKGPAGKHAEPEGPDSQEQQPLPLELRSLKTSHVMRWSGETAPNDHRLIMCERITVAHGAGEVTACLRMLVSGLPRVALQGKLVAQAPPLQEMRPKVKGEAEGEWKDPEPLQPGAKIDPKEYGGRNNWLKCCRTICEESGVETFLMPHVSLADGSTNLLYVYLDPYRGPGQLEGGQWTLEFFGSGEVEVGTDTMERDLEALVRDSWKEVPPPEDKPPRKDRAKASRQAWMRARGLTAPTTPMLEPPSPAGDAAPSMSKPPTQPPTPEVSAEELAAKAQQEELEGARGRQAQRTHMNTTILEFVQDITKTEAVLFVEDPYTIAPEVGPEPASAPGASGEAEPEGGASDAGPQEEPADIQAAQIAAEDEAEAPLAEEAEPMDGDPEVAVRALSSAGRAEARRKALEESLAYWTQAREDMSDAKGRNAQAIMKLATWREEFAPKPRMSWAETREAMRGDLQARVNKQAALTDVVNNAELEDPEKLRAVLAEAEQVNVGSWDPQLVDTAGEKAELLETYGRFKTVLTEESAKPEEEQLVDPSARQEFAQLFATVQSLLRKLQIKRVPLLAEIQDPLLPGKAEALLVEREMPAPAEEAAEQ